MAECVYHSDRYAFDALVRDMRKAGFVTREYANVMAMAVCTCRKKDTHRRPISTQEVFDAANHVIGSFVQIGTSTVGLLKCLSPLASHVVSGAAHTSQWKTSENQTSSQERLTIIISELLRHKLDPSTDETSNSTLLKEERDAARASMIACGRYENRAGEKETRRPGGKLSPDVIKKIIRKKKTKSPVVETFTLPLFGGSTRRLLNNDLVGPGFSRLGAKHGCVLELDSEATAEHMANKMATTVVQAWCPSREALNRVMDTLVELSREIQEPNDRAHKAATERRKTIRQYMNHQTAVQINVAKNNTAADNPTEYKEWLSFDFGTKVLHKPKYRDPQAKCKTPVLAEGHCLYCLLPFNEYKPGDKDVIKAEECRHHPGYVNADARWTCCNKECETKKPSNEAHAQNGCTTSNHCWRPHKKASRGAGEKAHRQERNFQEHRPTLAPHTLRPLVY